MIFKKKESTQELLGIEAITDYGISTKQGELVFFAVAPTNLSVLPADSIDARINALDDVEQGVYPCVNAVSGEHAQVGRRNGKENELALLRRYTVIRYSLNAEQLLCRFFLFEDHVGSLHSKYCWRVKKYAAA